MAYCRFLDADAYAYRTWDLEDRSKVMFDCCGCKLGGASYFETAEELFWHLVAHRLAGHYIPRYALEEVMDDALTKL